MASDRKTEKQALLGSAFWMNTCSLLWLLRSSASSKFTGRSCHNNTWSDYNQLTSTQYVCFLSGFHALLAIRFPLQFKNLFMIISNPKSCDHVIIFLLEICTNLNELNIWPKYTHTHTHTHTQSLLEE